MTSTACHQAEILAGAIALGEATDAERQSYRGHVSTCAACLRATGGEREIERTMTCVARARDEETWEPDLSARVRERMNGRKRLLRATLTVAGAALAISLGLNFVAVAGLGKIAPTFADPLVLNYDGQRIVLERRSTAALPQATSAPRMIVEHNVVNLTRRPGPAAVPATTRVAVVPAPLPHPAVAVAKQSGPRALPAVPYDTGATPVWRQGGGGGGASGISQPVPRLDQHAESIVVAPAYSVRAAEPIGGETALVPQPAPIAYAQNASGTSVFEVQIDERGMPTKCTITKSSGYLSLDDAVCSAAMKARYSPKLVNGKPVPGTYTDAFTFRSNNAGEGL